MYEAIAAGYKEVARQASPQLDKAALVSRLSEGGKGIKKTRVPDDECAPLIPRGAMIHFKSIEAARLKPGNVVFVRRGDNLFIRRFIRMQVTKTMLLVHIARLDGTPEKPITQKNLLGHILKVETKAGSFDPGRTTLKDFWTDFGTCSPMTKMLRLLKTLLPARFRHVSKDPEKVDD